MYVQIDNHGFGARIDVKPIKKEKVKYIKVRHVPDVESEEVKRIKKKWKEMREKKKGSILER